MNMELLVKAGWAARRASNLLREVETALLCGDVQGAEQLFNDSLRASSDLGNALNRIWREIDPGLGAGCAGCPD